MPQLFSDYRTQLLSYVSQEMSLAPDDLARQLTSATVDHVHFAPEGPELFSVGICHDGVTPIRYDLWAALTAAIGLAGGFVGANALSAAAAVLACLIALRGVRRRVSDGEGNILLALHRLGGEAALETLGETIRDMGLAMSETEVRERLFDLVQLGAVSLTADVARLEERVIVRYARLPQS